MAAGFYISALSSAGPMGAAWGVDRARCTKAGALRRLLLKYPVKRKRYWYSHFFRAFSRALSKSLTMALATCEVALPQVIFVPKS